MEHPENLDMYELKLMKFIQHRLAPRHAMPAQTESLIKSRRAFTLVEMLVVIAIIAVLAALIFSVSRGILAKANAAKCAGNLRQLHTASLGWSQDNNGWALQQFHEAGVVTWINALRPYLGNPKGVLGERPSEVFACPASSYLVDQAHKTASDYAINALINDAIANTSWGYAKIYKSYKLATMNDSSKVFFIGDGRALDPNQRVMGMSGFVRDPRANLHARHGKSANMLFYDGHVEALNPAIDAEVPPGMTAFNRPPWRPRD
jgi:prepilin-type N-terminal cleavage/methylation domain-containing protein/prepilin-type processing-associated H-X9-DG protein